MVAWQVAILVLIALFVGILIPVLLQARATLRNAGQLLAVAGERVPPMLEEAQGVMHRLNLVSEGLSGREERIGEIVEAAGEVAGTVARMKSSARIASTVGAAVAGAVKAYREVGAGVEPEGFEYPEEEREYEREYEREPAEEIAQQEREREAA